MSRKLWGFGTIGLCLVALVSLTVLSAGVVRPDFDMVPIRIAEENRTLVNTPDLSIDDACGCLEHFAPAFSLINANGEAIGLSDLRGRQNVLLSFLFFDDYSACERCQKELAQLVTSQEQLTTLGAELFVILWETTYQDFNSGEGQTTLDRSRVLLDDGGHAYAAYAKFFDTSTTDLAPKFVLTNRDGLVLWVGSGSSWLGNDLLLNRLEDLIGTWDSEVDLPR
jgi:hypothetical protein